MSETKKSEDHSWREVSIKSEQPSGDIVISYQMPNGKPDVKRYSRKALLTYPEEIIWMIVFHVCP